VPSRTRSAEPSFAAARGKASGGRRPSELISNRFVLNVSLDAIRGGAMSCETVGRVRSERFDGAIAASLQAAKIAAPSDLFQF
jgi:hypothetical protein